MSRPRWSVPNQCAPEGAATKLLPRLSGSYGAIHGPMIANSTKKATTARPTAAFALAMNRKFLRRAGMSSVGPPIGPSGMIVSRYVAGVAICSALLAGTRIEEQVRDIGQEVRGQHRERDDQEDALHQRVVLRADRLEQLVSHARIGEHDLHQQRAADDEAQ